MLNIIQEITNSFVQQLYFMVASMGYVLAIGFILYIGYIWWKNHH